MYARTSATSSGVTTARARYASHSTKSPTPTRKSVRHVAGFTVALIYRSATRIASSPDRAEAASVLRRAELRRVALDRVEERAVESLVEVERVLELRAVVL